MQWFAKASLAAPPIRAAMFDSSITLAEAVALGAGVALLPQRMFAQAKGRLAWPLDLSVDVGSSWLTQLKARASTPGMDALRDWLLERIAA